MIRLLNTLIIGPSVAIVDSSWIDMLAGLVAAGIRSVPPCFCATAGAAASTVRAARRWSVRMMGLPPLKKVRDAVVGSLFLTSFYHATEAKAAGDWLTLGLSPH